LSHGFNPIGLQHWLGIASVSQDGQSTKLGDSLAQELKPFADKIGLLDRDSGNVASRVRQALNQTAANRIECNSKDDRSGCDRLL
jgi:hypothetical protein